MTITQLQSAGLEPLCSMTELEPSRTGSFTFDQMKQSAGSTPMKRFQLDKIRLSDKEKGFAGFTTSLTESISESSEELTEATHTTTSSSLFKQRAEGAVSKSTILDGSNSNRHADEHEIEFEADEAHDIVGSWSTLRPFANVVDKDGGPAERALRMLDATAIESVKESALLSTVSSRSSVSTWEEGGSGSLLDKDEQSRAQTYRDGGDDDSDMSRPESPMLAIESFLEGLADIEDVGQLGSLLYQVGSCTYPIGAPHGSYDECDDDDYTVNSEMFPTVGASQHQRGRSRSPRSLTKTAPEDDTLSKLFKNISIQADSILEIAGSASSQPHTYLNSTQAQSTSPSGEGKSLLNTMFNACCSG